MNPELSTLATKQFPFALDDFRPLPFLGNPHIQTLLGFFLQSSRFHYPTKRHVIWTPEGDGLVLHDSIPARWRPGDRMILLIHGLTGSHRSPLIVRLATQFLARDVRVVRIDLRGTGAGLPLARQCYHGGRSEDVRAALAAMHHLSPASPLLVLGVSLGGNLTLKLAGEMPTYPVPGLARIAALGPPIDLVRGATLLSKPSNRFYERNFLRILTDEAEQRQRIFPDLPPVSLPRRLTMRQFDDLYTAPRNGFIDALDYYQRASSLPLLDRISVPTLILTARDDPFIAVEPFESLQLPSPVMLRILPQGGHLGFVGWDGEGGVRWAERRVLAWLLHS